MWHAPSILGRSPLGCRQSPASSILSYPLTAITHDPDSGAPGARPRVRGYPAVSHGQESAARDRRRGGRQHPRVVRLRPVRLLRAPDRTALFPVGKRHRVDPRGVRHFRRRIHHAPGGRGALRLDRRPLRPQAGPARLGPRDGVSLFLRRPAAGRGDPWRHRHGPAGAVPADPGHRGGRRIHGLGGLPGRGRRAGAAGLDGQLWPLRRHSGHPARLGLGLVDQPAAHAGSGIGLGLASPLRHRGCWSR